MVENSDELCAEPDMSLCQAESPSESGVGSLPSFCNQQRVVSAIKLVTEEYVNSIRTGSIHCLEVTCKHISAACGCDVPSDYEDKTIDEVAFRV